MNVLLFTWLDCPLNIFSQSNYQTCLKKVDDDEQEINLFPSKVFIKMSVPAQLFTIIVVGMTVCNYLGLIIIILLYICTLAHS